MLNLPLHLFCGHKLEIIDFRVRISERHRDMLAQSHYLKGKKVSVREAFSDVKVMTRDRSLKKAF